MAGETFKHDFDPVLQSGIPWIGITGSLGKSSTAVWLRRMLVGAGQKVYLGGGGFRSPFKPEDKVQRAILQWGFRDLAAPTKFAPPIGILTGLIEQFEGELSPSQLAERYARLFSGQGQTDYLIFNAESQGSVELAGKARSRPFRVYLKDPKAYSSEIFECVFYRDDEIHLRRDAQSDECFPTAKLRLGGKAALLNAMYAVAAARLSGAGVDAIQSALESFSGLASRMQACGNVGGLNFYDDACSTDPAATAWGLTGFDRPVVLLIDGDDAGRNFRPLRRFLKNKVKLLILAGPARKRTYSVLKDECETFLVADLPDALGLIRQKALVGDSVIYSPAGKPPPGLGCLERGRKFRKLILSA